MALTDRQADSIYIEIQEAYSATLGQIQELVFRCPKCKKEVARFPTYLPDSYKETQMAILRDSICNCGVHFNAINTFLLFPKQE